MRITIQADGGTVDAEVTVGDMIRYEKKFGETIAELQLSAGGTILAGHLEKTLYLAWVVAKRTKATDLDFLDWCDTVELEAQVPVVADSGPLDRQSGTSLHSQSRPVSSLPSLPEIRAS